MLFWAGSFVFAFPCRVLGRAGRIYTIVWRWVCVPVCECACPPPPVCVPACAHTHAWRPEVNTGCLPQSIFILLFETGSLAEPGAEPVASKPLGSSCLPERPVATFLVGGRAWTSCLCFMCSYMQSQFPKSLNNPTCNQRNPNERLWGKPTTFRAEIPAKYGAPVYLRWRHCS